MSPGQFANYAVQRHKCEIIQKGNADVIWLKSPKERTCYIPVRYRVLKYEQAVFYCNKLSIDIISEIEYRNYE
jgi:hypothetical protein